MRTVPSKTGITPKKAAVLQQENGRNELEFAGGITPANSSTPGAYRLRFLFLGSATFTCVVAADAA